MTEKALRNSQRWLQRCSSFCRANILLVVFVSLWVGLPMGLSVLGVGRWLKQANLSAAAFPCLIIGLGLAIVVLLTMTLREIGPIRALKELGLIPFSLRAILVSLLGLATMAAILCLAGHRPAIPAPGSLVTLGIAGTLAEEVGFRGFLFLQFRRWAVCSFWLAALLSSALFGLAHYGQGRTLALSLAVTGVTFVGGALFCWLTERWGNLWAGIVLHAGLDLLWATFQLGDNAVGNLLANAARLAAVAVVIAGTVAFTRRPSQA